MGFFLTIEGGEGAGKTTCMGFVRHWLIQRNIDFVETREPGGTAMAEDIRSLLLAEHVESVSETTELLMMFAARSQNLSENIIPALAQGKVVLCDRFTDATYAYQGGGRGIDEDRIALLEQLVQGTLRPDLTLLLDVDPEVGMARAKGRGGKLDRIEQEAMSFFQQVRATYLERASRFPRQYAVIDAGQSVEQVSLQIVRVLEQRLNSGEK